MKKNILLLLFLLSTMLIAACSSDIESASSSNKDYTMRVGHTLNAESPRHKILMKFEEEVERQTDGHIKVELYPSNQIGDNNQLIQSVPLGTVEAAVQPTSFFGGIQNKLSVIDIPFIWEDLEHTGEVLSGEAGEVLLDLLEEKEMKGVALWPLGMKFLTSNTDLEGAPTLKGQKVRTMGTPVLLDVFKSWEASPASIAIPELYSSLQQGVIDGQENDLGTIHDLKIYEVQDYILETNHGAIVDLFYLNLDWFNSLPSEYQDIITNVAKGLTDERVALELEQYEIKRQNIIESGKGKLIPVSEKQVQALSNSSQVVREIFLNQYPDMEKVLEAASK